MPNIRIVFSICIIWGLLCYSAYAAEISEYMIYCNDIEAVYFYESPEYGGGYTHAGELHNGVSYSVVFELSDKAADEYMKVVYSQEGSPRKDYINGVLYQDIPDMTDIFKEYGNELREVAKQKRKHFSDGYIFVNYSDALKYADQYCPNKVVRGEDRVLVEYPRIGQQLKFKK